MTSLQKFYVRATRDSLNRYPNWPINQVIGLGQVGYYSGRNAEFRWYTSLSKLGLNVATIGPESLADELHTSEEGVDLDFAGDAGQAVKANFTFQRKRSIATQGYKMDHSRLDLADLLTQLRAAIKAKKVQWDFDWLILTELWRGDAFTTLISGRQKGRLSISATAPTAGPAFNIANPSLGLGISSSSGMAYQGVAEKSPQARIAPYFHVHKLVDHDKKGLVLKRYADDDGWFWWPL